MVIEFATRSEIIEAFKASKKFLDVRAEIEFAKGTLPGSQNLPILNTDERSEVGTCYKTLGSAAAVLLGESLVRGENRQRKITSWLEFFRLNPEGLLFCFRGGMRSQYAQNWLRDSGLNIRRVEGGYKEYRRYFIDILQTLPVARNFVVVSGKTGCGKTILINKVGVEQNSIDLEALACHRGSSFGGFVTPQPSQIDFENTLAVALLKTDKNSVILIEDESRLIGARCLPDALVNAKLLAPVVYIDDPMATRIQRIFSEYVEAPLACFEIALVAEKLRSALGRIKNRLGGATYGKISARLEAAFTAVDQVDAVPLHYEWISALLQCYYDPQYDHYFSKKKDRIMFRGTSQEVESFLVDRLGTPAI